MLWSIAPVTPSISSESQLFVSPKSLRDSSGSRRTLAWWVCKPVCVQHSRTFTSASAQHWSLKLTYNCRTFCNTYQFISREKYVSSLFFYIFFVKSLFPFSVVGLFSALSLAISVRNSTQLIFSLSRVKSLTLSLLFSCSRLLYKYPMARALLNVPRRCPWYQQVKRMFSVAPSVSHYRRHTCFTVTDLRARGVMSEWMSDVIHSAAA